jgi:hypothetical protein
MKKHESENRINMKLAILPLILCLYSFAGLCQRPPGGPPSKEDRMTRTMETLKKEIKMTSSQEKGIESVFDDFFTQAEKLRTGPRGPEQKAAMEKLVKDRDEKVSRILDKEQFAAYLTAMEKMRPPGRGGQRGDPPGGIE